MIALVLLATSAVILVQAQTAAVRMQEDATRMSVATMLARDLMTELTLKIEKEGFGELEVHEHGDFNDERYGGHFDGWRWEYEVEKVDIDIPNLSNLMGLGGDEDEGAGLGGGNAGLPRQQGGNDLETLSNMGMDFSFFSEMMGNYLREARVRVCWEIDTNKARSEENEDCIEYITHLTNPTGQVTAAEEEEE